MHEVPHAVASVSLAHLAPRLWKPVLHEKPQVPLAHVAAWAFAGNGHGAQLDAPHALMSLTLGHEPPHRCVLAGQVPEHGAALSMHAPRHSDFCAGQVPPHWPLSQVAVPPLVGAEQGEQDAPHVCGLVLSAHPCGHMCWVLEHDGAASTTEPSLGPGPSLGPEPSLGAGASLPARSIAPSGRVDPTSADDPPSPFRRWHLLSVRHVSPAGHAFVGAGPQPILPSGSGRLPHPASPHTAAADTIASSLCTERDARIKTSPGRRAPRSRAPTRTRRRYRSPCCGPRASRGRRARRRRRLRRLPR